MLRRNKEQIRNRPASADRGRAVFSYYSNRASGDPAARPAASRSQVSKSWWMRNAPAVLAVFAIGSSFIYLIGVDPNPKLVQVSATSDTVVYRDAAEYQESAHEIIAGSLTNRNKLTINRTDIIRQLQAQFPELAASEITIPIMGRRPIIRISASQPALLFSSGGNAYVLNDQGVALMKVSDSVRLNRHKLPVVQDELSLPLEVGKAAIPAAHVTNIKQLAAQFSEKQLEVESFVMPSIPNELHVRLKNYNYYVKFNLLTDARQQAGALFAIQEHLRASGGQPAEYIDVRVEERVFYK